MSKFAEALAARKAAFAAQQERDSGREEYVRTVPEVRTGTDETPAPPELTLAPVPVSPTLDLSGLPEAYPEDGAPYTRPYQGQARAVDAEVAQRMGEAREDHALDEALRGVFATGTPTTIHWDPSRTLGALPTAPEPIPPILLSPLSFLCGAGGSGKTHLAKQWVRQHPGTVLAATTGIAAVNLGEGTTINALLKYFDTASLEESHVSGHLTATLGKLWKSGVRRILLDEVSMLDAVQLTCIVRSLQQLAGRGYTMDVRLADEVQAGMAEEGLDSEQHLPISLTVVGDFAQLPPVKAEYAFESPEWEPFGQHTHQLTKIWRQSDAAFIGALMAARRGEVEPVVEFFRHRLEATQDPGFVGTTVLGKNESVDAYNALRMDKHKGSWARYATKRWGKPRGDWKNIPDTLGLKEGALVMILANKRLEGFDGMPGPLVYANGDLGEVVECGAQTVDVRLYRNHEVVTVDYLKRLNTVPLEPGRAKELKGLGQDGLISEKNEVVGSVDYLPLRVAYATTCHKSQGLSLDAVQVNTREGMFKQAGLLYVALSRCRTAEGLRLVGSVDGLRSRVTVHKKVLGYL